MTLTDKMSVPQWRIALRQKQQRKKEEEKRRQREEEERRLAALPPWKRHAEQPKTVIIIDKNKVANEVNLSSSAGSPAQKDSQSSAGKQPQTLANGSAPSVSSGGSESLASHGKVGQDETDSSRKSAGGKAAEPSGVSEEHCTPVQDNPFLKLERKKRRAPPPPKGGSQISVIASNVSGGSVSGVALAGDKSASTSTSKKTVAPAAPASSISSKDSVSSVPQSSNKTNKSGPSTGKQSQISTTNGNVKQSARVEQKENLQSDVPKSKPEAPTKVVSDSATSSIKDTTKARADAAQSESHKTSETVSSGVSKQSKDAQKRTSISELRTLFGSPATSKPQAPSVSQASQQNSGSSSGSAKPSDSKSNQTQPTSANEKIPSVTPAVVGGSKQTNSSSQQSPEQTSVKVAEQKKNDTNSKTFIDNKQEKALTKAKEKERENTKSRVSSESKSLPSAGKGSPQRQKPSSDLSASAIISLTNEGPLQKRQGELVRSSSILDEDEVIELTLETPVSPRRRLKDSSKEEVEKGSAEVSQGEQQPSKRRAPVAPATVNGSAASTASVKGDDGKPPTENVTPSTVRKSEVQNEIEYPKNFRDPKYVPSSKQKDVPSSNKRESSAPVVTSKEKLPASKLIADAGPSPVGVAEQTSFKGEDTSFKGEKTSFKEETKFKGEETDSGNSTGVAKPSSGNQARSVKTVEKTSDAVRDKEKKSDKSSPATGDQNAIPYPHQFRNFGSQQTSSKSKDEGVKDIIKPSDMRKASSSSTSSDSNKGKGDSDSGVVTTSPFGSIKLRPTKSKDAGSGISVIAVQDNKPKEKVTSAGSANPSRLIAVGGAAKSEDKKKNVKKFEKVDMIGYNSPSGKPSALKKGGKSPKKQVKFDSKEEDVFEYLSEEAFIKDYNENQTKDETKEEEAKRTSPTMNNGLNNGTISDESDDEDSTSGLKNNTAVKSGGFHNYAASTLSATDLLLGRGRPEEPKEPPKPAPQPEPEAEPESDSRPLVDGDIFSTAGTAALLF
ncbi:uncharacterized protein [Diadema antillarum]|uniref:uncharacterized protein n=1 Tax=Diadema antillarum TaxID=105358 RepID=UPI003A8599C0